ncbi:hypothetical protein I4U23_004936 [Adineta vaga]|nr:hypothetical protein I4U23_004936 [Adineta vaga]
MASRRSRDITDRVRRMERGGFQEQTSSLASTPSESTSNATSDQNLIRLVSNEDVPKESIAFYDNCKRYSQLTQKPLVSVADDIFSDKNECVSSTIMVGVDTKPENFDLDEFLENFKRILKLNRNEIQPVSINLKPLLIELKLKQQQQDHKLSTIKMVYSKLTDETLKDFHSINVFVLILGSSTSLDKLQKLRNQITMDSRYNRIYGPNHAFWQGPNKDGRDRGNKPYYCPVGWKRYSFFIPGNFDEKFKGWCICYHGTKFDRGLSILLSGLKPANVIAHGVGIYTTPSIIYASHPRYADVKYIDSNAGLQFFKSGHYVQFVLECRVHPKDIRVASETLGAAQLQIDPNINCSEIEWVVNNYGKDLVDFNDPEASIVCTGVMLRITDRHPALLAESDWWFTSKLRKMPDWEGFYNKLLPFEEQRQAGMSCNVIFIPVETLLSTIFKMDTLLKVSENIFSSELFKELVPLKEVSIDARIHSFAADVTITQVFQNDESIPIEAVYCFPIEENAAIYAFIAHIDNEREIIAEIKETKVAQQEYSEALAHGHGAYLLEQNEASNDIFVISVGALKPKSKCCITISYVSELDLLHGNEKSIIRFVIPTTISPRYSPNQKGISSPDGTQVQYAESVPYTIDLQCHVNKLEQNVTSVSSPSHSIKIDISNPDIFLIHFSQQRVQLDRDIIIDVELSQFKPNTIAAIEKGALMVSFMPNEQDCQQNMSDIGNEFLFIIDCSGSMQDENKIGLVRKAMILFLKSLPVNCYFNIIRFGSSFLSLFDKKVSVPYNQKTMDQVESLIKNMTADLGGTELLAPLTWLMNNKPNEGRMRQIFLLTDGEISNVDLVIKICEQMAAYTRIFSFGLGYAPSHALVKGLARATNGHFTFIPPNTNVDIHVAEQLTRALRPNLTNMSIKWKTNQTILFDVSERSSPVFIGDRLLFYALLDESTPFDDKTTVELLSKEHEEPISVVSIQHPMSNCSSQMITRLAAKAVLRELQSTWKTTSKKLFIDLSIKYGILCPYTAFIGVEKRLDVDSESNANMKLREVSIMPTPTYIKLQRQSQSYGFTSTSFESGSCQADMDDLGSLMQYTIDGALERSENISSLSAKAADLQCQSGSFRKRTGMSSGSVFLPLTGFISSIFSKKPMNYGAREKSTIDHWLQQDLAVNWPTDERQLVERFIEKQQYDGLWTLTEDDVKKLTNKSLADFASSLLNKIEKNTQHMIITTILTIVILEKCCVSSKTLWQILANKGRKRVVELLGGNQTIFEQLMEHTRHQII